MLRCWGAEGRLQLGVVYLQTGNSGGRAERMTTMRKLVASLEGWSKALTIVTGDFNFVVDKMDRVSGEQPEFTGGGDAREAAAVQALLEKVGLQELEQGEYTYRFESCRSRLDRMYTNMGRYEWLDRDIGCVALDLGRRHVQTQAHCWVQEEQSGGGGRGGADTELICWGR